MEEEEHREKKSPDGKEGGVPYCEMEGQVRLWGEGVETGELE